MLSTGVARARAKLRARRHSVRLPVVPWFDLPEAAGSIDARAVDDADRALLRSWVRDGYAVVEDLVPHHLIDAMVDELDRLFTRDDLRTNDQLVVNDLVFGDGHRATTTLAELRLLPIDERMAARDRSNWRVHGLFQHSDAAERIRDLPEMRRIASMILGLEALARYSINFHNGSAQALHEDSAVFHLGVPNMICGAWVACEDIDEGAGPLVYYPGSHRRPSFSGFADYPLTNLRTADPATTAAYQQHVDTDAERAEPHTFLARKGDVLFWHGMLIHGGSRIIAPERTRRSYVLHYLPAGVDVADQIAGPTNW